MMEMHSEDCWCYGTGWREDIGQPCNMGAHYEESNNG